MSKVGPIWIVAEHNNDEIEEVSLEVLSKGRKLADELSEETSVVIFDGNSEKIATQLASYGADKLVLIRSSCFPGCSIEFYEDCLFRFFEERKANIILFGGTFFGNDVASRFALRMKTALVSDCIDLSLNEQGLLLQTKLTHGGKISSTIVCAFSKPQISTVRPGVFRKKKLDFNQRIKVIVINPQQTHRDTRVKVKGIVKADPDKIGLDEAEIIVAGGRGMGTKTNFELIKHLAMSLGGVVGASLGAIDEGFAPRKNLIGQTGMTVAPKLYVACGISGSIYHVLGMKDSDAIIAINKDRFAPILKYCDMAILGDVVEILPAIIEEVDKLSRRENIE